MDESQKNEDMVEQPMLSPANVKSVGKRAKIESSEVGSKMRPNEQSISGSSLLKFDMEVSEGESLDSNFLRAAKEAS